MKWFLFVWFMTGPPDAALAEYRVEGFAYEYDTYEKCNEALRITQTKVEGLDEFRGAVLECRQLDAELYDSEF